ncbi:MAG TPA: DnaJ C-terminal domain-containing protein [Steroidobacteraceae bacterium]|jgi:curved DNA-binding protein|nr:DnaJ C-terminal domain-containing protein [Steroidobacteraceae bacterium]
MEFRDYYKVLGVERSATADQVKTAYRRLARRYHPDVSKEKDAEARFKETQEAYEVLKDPQKRAAYDELGSDWKSGQQFRPPPGWDGAAAGHARRARSRGPDGDAQFTDEQFSDFFSSLFGAEARHAAGARRARAGRDHHARVELDLEEAFRGTTRTLELRHPELKPDGSVELRSRTVRVNIPAGVTEGQLVRLAGQGEPAAGAGAAGDLYLEVHIQPHAQYQLDGRDVTVSFAIAPWEAALGAAVTVPTLGGAVAMQIPAGAQSGQKLRLRGRGLPGQPAGDQYVQLKVVLPPADTPQAQALYEEMRAKLNFNPRAT